MSKSQSEFHSPKKLCRALHSDMYSLIKLVFECIFDRWEKELVLHINFKKRKIFVSNEKYVTSKIFFGETKMIDISCTIVFCEVLRHCRI